MLGKVRSQVGSVRQEKGPTEKHLEFLNFLRKFQSESGTVNH
jgi:hypothetical protein